MARTPIAAQALEGAYGDYGANEADMTQTAADEANGNSTPWSGSKLLVIADNQNAGAQTITFTSVADAFGRTGHITDYSIGIGEIGVFGPFEPDGWMQADGSLYYTAAAADVFISVLALP